MMVEEDVADDHGEDYSHWPDDENFSVEFQGGRVDRVYEAWRTRVVREASQMGGGYAQLLQK